MNALVRSLILGVLLVAAASVAVTKHNEQVSQLELERDLQHLRAAWAERTGVIWASADQGRYRDELASAIRWYDAELASIYNRHPGVKHDPDSALARMEEEAAKGKRKGGDEALRKEFFDNAKRAYDLLQSGRYNPTASVTQHGVRIDLLGMKREMYEGKSRLRVDVAVWGAPRREMVVKGEAGKPDTARMQLDFLLSKLSLEFTDEKQKLVGGGDTGAPVILVDHPEHWIPDFPPQGAFAIWYIDPLPREAHGLSLKLAGEVRSPASPALAINHQWNLPAADEWKVRDGEVFEAETRMMPEEDMARGR